MRSAHLSRGRFLLAALVVVCLGGCLPGVAWLPDSSGIIFHNVINKPTSLSVLATWNQAKAQLWFVDVPTGAAPALWVFSPALASNFS